MIPNAGQLSKIYNRRDHIMSELTAKENINTADPVKRITATAVMAALTTLMTAYIFHIPVGVTGG